MKPVAVIGPCRSGKSTSIVVPTLLTWQESAIVGMCGQSCTALWSAQRCAPARLRRRKQPRFLGQVVRHATQECSQVPLNRMLMVLDDFTALGLLDDLADSLAHMSGYGIKPLLAIQNLAQLSSTYGKGNNVWPQCSIRIVLPLNDLDTAASVAEEIGCIVARSCQAGSDQCQVVSPDELIRLLLHRFYLWGEFRF